MGAMVSSGVQPTTVQPNLGITSQVVTSSRVYWMLWFTFGVMALAAVVFAAMTFKKPLADRTHGYLSTMIVCIAATSYLAMAMHGGNTLVPEYYDRTLGRPVWWARYIDWFLTTPLLLLDLLTVAAVPVGTYLWVAFADLMMILFGLFGALLPWGFRWVWYGLGCVWMFIVFHGILVMGPRYAKMRSTTLALKYGGLATFLMGLFCIYPVVWGLAEGANVISPLTEVVWYACLDICAKVIFGFAILAGLGPTVAQTLNQERAKGMHDISLLESPINAPLSGVRQRIPVTFDQGHMPPLTPTTQAATDAQAHVTTIPGGHHHHHHNRGVGMGPGGGVTTAGGPTTAVAPPAAAAVPTNQAATTGYRAV